MENVRQGSGLEKARVMWHRRQWLALLVCVPVLAAAVAVSRSLPNVYESTATVLVDHPQGPGLGGGTPDQERARGIGECPDWRPADDGNDGVSAGAVGGRPGAAGGRGGADQRLQGAAQRGVAGAAGGGSGGARAAERAGARDRGPAGRADAAT